jgi:hypothetical protein
MFPPQNSEINTPRGYYLQLSGWYQNNPQISNVKGPQFDEEYDDLPF